MTSATIVSDYPPGDGKEYDGCCARCGSSVEYVRCEDCEDGFNGHDCGEDCCCCLHPEENVPCDTCRGHGGWYACTQSPEWCRANPLPNRSMTVRYLMEWTVVERSRDLDDFGRGIFGDVT